MFKRLRRKIVRLALVSGAGAAAAYFFDPERGVARRRQAQDQIEAKLRRRQADAEREARHAANVAQGEAAAAQGAGVPRPVDDVEVVNVVKQALAGLDVDTTNVTVESVDGIVTVRGEIPSREAKTAIEEAVTATPGVIEVQSFLHTPGTPAPNKAASLRAS
ncbi:MAG TPA: BON domain-containing protein [Acidimicrobiales bacterium]|nr:BON domain-containing protein [Acidimicrobiales bacterium]